MFYQPIFLYSGHNLYWWMLSSVVEILACQLFSANLTCTTGGWLSVDPVGPHYSKYLIIICIFQLKIHLKMLFAKWQPSLILLSMCKLWRIQLQCTNKYLNRCWIIIYRIWFLQNIWNVIEVLSKCICFLSIFWMNNQVTKQWTVPWYNKIFLVKSDWCCNNCIVNMFVMNFSTAINSIHVITHVCVRVF